MMQQSQERLQEQKRGASAWQYINMVKEESNSRNDKGQLEKDYRSRVRSLNSMIQINGLGATLGFLNAKSNAREKDEPANASYYLLQHISWWMSKQSFIVSTNTSVESVVEAEMEIDETEDETTESETPETPFEGYGGFLQWLIKAATRDQYRRATTECLAFGLWLRRFAEAELQSSSPSQVNAGQNTEQEVAVNIAANGSTLESSTEGTSDNGE